MNIAVINLKDLIKYIICFIVIVSIISFGINILKKEEFREDVKNEEIGIFENLKNSSFLYCLRQEITLIGMNDEDIEEEIPKENVAEKILSAELLIMENLEDDEENIEIKEDKVSGEQKNIEETKENNEDIKVEEAKDSLKTQVIDANNLKESYTNQKNSIRVNNQTKFNINDILDNPHYELKNKNKVIIYHTHTSESYTSRGKYEYNMTGNYRTTDLNYTVSRVGDELSKCLEGYGKTVIHDKTYHDYPAYNGSYGRSLATMEKLIKNNNDAEIMIDLHRDAVRKQ